MISKVVFIGDPYRGEQAVNIEKIKSLFSPVLRQLGIPTQAHITDINRNSNRDVWIPIWKNSLASYPSSAIGSLGLQDIAVIGFETPEAELNYLSKHNIPWINFCIHPLRFLDDLYFEVSTSFAYDMQNVIASSGLIDICAGTLFRRYAPIAIIPTQITLLVCGQDWPDRSIYFDHKFCQLKDYVSQLDALALQYERVLYKPHPAFESTEISEFITDRYQAQLCSKPNIYELFIIEGIQTVCAISSSVLTEAPSFGVHPVFLEPRAKRYGPAISYRALIDETEFWDVAFLGREMAQDQLSLSPGVPSNHLRRTFSSWGFVTEEGRISQLESRIIAAESKAQEAESKAQQAESKAQQAESKAQEAESKAQEAESKAQQAESKAQQAESKAQEAESKAQQAIAASDEYQARLMSIDKSTSWRITKPLRWTLDHLRSQRIPSDLSGLKQLVKTPLLLLIRLVGSQPKLKDLVIRSAARLRVSGRLRSLYWSSKAVPSAINSGFPMSQDFRQLSPRARHIYAGLKQAIEQHHEDIR